MAARLGFTPPPTGATGQAGGGEGGRRGTGLGGRGEQRSGGRIESLPPTKGKKRSGRAGKRALYRGKDSIRAPRPQKKPIDRSRAALRGEVEDARRGVERDERSTACPR